MEAFHLEEFNQAEQTLNETSAHFVNIESFERIYLKHDLKIYDSDLFENGTDDEFPYFCLVQKRGTRWLIKDFDTQRGIWVNGTQVIEAYLSNGDQLKFAGQDYIFLSTQPAIKNINPLITKNTSWAQSLNRLPGISKSDFPILLIGPTGSGKELLARSIHALSLRKANPFYNIKCSSYSKEQIEVELFGDGQDTEFITGKSSQRKGILELAKNGTLLIEDIEELPPQVQAKLFKAIDASPFKKWTGEENKGASVRVIASSTQELSELVKSYKFRSDLYYRLNVIRMNVPALKQRMEDFDDILLHYSQEAKLVYTELAIKKLHNHSWPGNIRELKSLVQRAKTLLKSQTIDGPDVDLLIEPKTDPRLNSFFVENPDGSKNLIKEMEKKVILSKLTEFQGNQKQTALALGIPKSTLNDKIKAWGVNCKSFKNNLGSSNSKK